MKVQPYVMLDMIYKKLDLGFDSLKISKKEFDPKEIPEDTPEALVKLIVKGLKYVI